MTNDNWAAIDLYTLEDGGPMELQALGEPVATRLLEAVQSNESADHNPGRLALFLVSGICRAHDHAVLAPRLRSLSANLICVSVK